MDWVVSMCVCVLTGQRLYSRLVPSRRFPCQFLGGAKKTYSVGQKFISETVRLKPTDHILMGLLIMLNNVAKALVPLSHTHTYIEHPG